MVRLLQSWRQSSAVPPDWRPAPPPGAVIKDPVKDPEVLKALQEALPGRWVKVYRMGADGSELHYFQHASGAVAFVKLKWKKR
jgi:hypothetical protein